MSFIKCAALNESQLFEDSRRYVALVSNVTDTYIEIHRYIYRILCVIGVMANIAIVTVLLRPSMRKNPFNVFLIAIAICDLIVMANYFIFKQVEICHPWFFSYAFVVYTKSYAIFSVVLHSISLYLTVNMAVLRYLVIRGSATSSSQHLNSYGAVTVAIAIAFIVSIVGSGPNILRYEIYSRGQIPVPSYCLESPYRHHYTPGDVIVSYNFRQPGFWDCRWERISFWTAGIVLKVIPCALLTVFMTLLVRFLLQAKKRRSRLVNGLSSTAPKAASSGGKTAPAERTTAMLVVIVFVFLVTELPQGLLVIKVGLTPAFGAAVQKLGDLTDLLSLLNSSVNFILYAVMSNLFRQEFLAAFRECYPNYLRRRAALSTSLAPPGPDRRKSTQSTACIDPRPTPAVGFHALRSTDEADDAERQLLLLGVGANGSCPEDTLI